MATAWEAASSAPRAGRREHVVHGAVDPAEVGAAAVRQVQVRVALAARRPGLAAVAIAAAALAALAAREELPSQRPAAA